MSTVLSDIDIEGTLPGHHPNVKYQDVFMALSAAAIAQLQIARHLGGEAGKSLSVATSAAMQDWDDWYCGNGKRPGPVPHFSDAQAVATQLGTLALNLPEGS